MTMTRLIQLILLMTMIFGTTKMVAQCPTVGISGTHVSCFGGFNGTVHATVSGGSGNFSYVWNNGGTTSTITNLTAGIYYVNVTDLISGCTVFNLFVVNEPEQLVSSLSQQNVKCFGFSTGSIDLTPGGGTPNYTYAWSNGATTKNLSGLAAGFYSITITDFKGCKATNSTTITQTASAVNSTILGTNVNCSFGSDGAINLTPFGGTPPYTYNWNSGAYVSEDISGLMTGPYNVVITDALGCTGTKGIFISEPTAITSSVGGSDVSCYGGSNGLVDLTVSGGTSPYSFNWTSSVFTLGNTEDLVNIIADGYHVIITDAHGCTATNNYTVNQPTQLVSSLTGTNVSCNGYSDGKIILQVNGGSPNYQFAWSNSLGPISATTQNLINIPAESYEVVITDIQGCTKSSSITITQPLLPLEASIIGTDVKCYGDNSGSADLSITGGTSPYAVTWSNGPITEDQLSLFIGNYIATITDINGCLTSTNVIINQPLAKLTSSSIITPATCYGSSNGNIDYTVNGGTQPYRYAWINSQFALSVTSQDISNYPADSYITTITDANNCVLVDTSVITQPTQLQTTIASTNINCYGKTTGVIDLTLTGGITAYSITWSNNAVTEDINNLAAGHYVVNIVDANGCQHSDSVTLTQTASGLSAANFVKNATCYGSADGYIFYDVQGGTLPYVNSWSNGDTTANIFNLTAGQYIVTTTDGNGCTLPTVITVQQPSQITVAYNANPVQCFGQSNGGVDITVTGGTTPYTYQWMDAQFVLSAITQDLTNYPAGTYNVKVTDSVGCETMIAIVIQEPAKLGASVTANNITCAGGSDGNIDITISGGVVPYSYSWSTGETTEDLLNIPVGSYTVIITDANSCSLEEVYTLVEPPPIDVTYQVQEVTCSDQMDGMIYITATGGTGGYSYAWSNGTTSNPITNLGGGTYTIVVTDAVGCTKQLDIEMIVNPQECIEIPTAFTPNGDGKNDLWQIKNIELYPHCNMKIFNRWGNLLFESEGYYEFWNGRYNGNKLPSETYYYILNLGNDTNPKTGPVTLIY